MLLLTLTGCKTFWNPTFIPSGYSHHHDEYKSPPGAEAKNIGYDYTAAQNQQVLEEWHIAARDLVLRANTNGVLPAGPVFLTTNMSSGSFQGAFDFTLREALRAQGQTLAATADQGTTLAYSASAPKGKDAPVQNKGAALQPFNLSLGTLDDKGDLANTASAIYDVPPYGFKGSLASLSLGKNLSPISVTQDKERNGFNN